MKKLLDNLASLVKVKTMVTVTLLVVYAVLALRGDVLPDKVQDLVGIVVAFYFGTQMDKRKGDSVGS